MNSSIEYFPRVAAEARILVVEPTWHNAYIAAAVLAMTGNRAQLVTLSRNDEPQSLKQIVAIKSELKGMRRACILIGFDDVTADEASVMISLLEEQSIDVVSALTQSFKKDPWKEHFWKKGKDTVPWFWHPSLVQSGYGKGPIRLIEELIESIEREHNCEGYNSARALLAMAALEEPSSDPFTLHLASARGDMLRAGFVRRVKELAHLQFDVSQQALPHIVVAELLNRTRKYTPRGGKVYAQRPLIPGKFPAVDRQLVAQSLYDYGLDALAIIGDRSVQQGTYENPLLWHAPSACVSGFYSRKNWLLLSSVLLGNKGPGFPGELRKKLLETGVELSSDHKGFSYTWPYTGDEEASREANKLLESLDGIFRS